MEERPSPAIKAGAAIRDAFSLLARRPFRGVLALSVLIALVLETLPDEGDTTTLLGALLLIVLSLYLQITMTLAAANEAASESVDVWLKQAFRRRCFWRYAAASILVMLAVVVAGAVGLVIGGLLVGGVLALTDQAVVLEGRSPLEAIARSADLSKPARLPLAVIFGLLVLIPGLSVQIGTMIWDLDAFFGGLWPLVPVVVIILGLAGTIALTKAYLALGGNVVPTRPRRGAEA